MKKNKMMRIASVLLVMTLLSTCAISGTFAKYVTKAEGSDSARVAKWGIVLDLKAGNAFAKEYKTHDTTYKGAVSVQAEENVVAPGTSSKDLDAGITGSIKGKPEVATRYTIEIKNIEDVKLPKKTGYTDYTVLNKTTDATTGKVTYAYDGTFDLTEDYTPIKWDLTVGTVTVTAKSLSEVLARSSEIAGKLSEIGTATVEATDNSLKITMDVDPNKDLNLDFSLGWAWTFEGNDQADTYLGNVAAGVVTDANAKITVKADVTLTATQID